jgi:hypothetical protein
MVSGRIGKTGNCRICGKGTTGAEGNLCFAARAGRDCKKIRREEITRWAKQQKIIRVRMPKTLTSRQKKIKKT